MKTIARLCLSVAVLFFVVAPALAQTQYRFELFGAGSFPRNEDFFIGLPQFSPAIELSHEYSRGVRGGIRVGADFKKYWGEDIIYSFGTNATKIANLTNGVQFPLNERIHQFAVNALWYPGGASEGGRVFPYLTAGVGATFFVLTPETVNAALEAGLGTLHTENLFAFNAGGGIRMRLTRHIGLRYDVRDYMTRAPRFGLPVSSDDPSASVFPARGVFHQFEGSFAFVYHF
jgi:opacity protein-like surface antigen